jgi:hypothetical protein
MDMANFSDAQVGTPFTVTVTESAINAASTFYSAGSNVKINGTVISGITLSGNPTTKVLTASGTYLAAAVGNPTLKHVPRNGSGESITSVGFSSVDPATRQVYQYIAPTSVTATFEYQFKLSGVTSSVFVTQVVTPDYSSAASALNTYI